VHTRSTSIAQLSSSACIIESSLFGANRERRWRPYSVACCSCVSTQIKRSTYSSKSACLTHPVAQVEATSSTSISIVVLHVKAVCADAADVTRVITAGAAFEVDKEVTGSTVCMLMCLYTIVHNTARGNTSSKHTVCY
jgi:hypothetical protein